MVRSLRAGALLAACLAMMTAVHAAGPQTGQAFRPLVMVTVTGGAAAVTDWVAEVTLDLGTAQRLLGVAGGPERVAVREVTSPGATVRVASQIDDDRATGLCTVAWRLPGALAAGARRQFAIGVEAATGTAPASSGLEARAEGDTITVSNGAITMVHDRTIGGMIRQVSVRDRSAALTWNDKIFDGQVYYLANHRAETMQLTAGGPLRAAVATAGEFRDGSQSAPGKPRAGYRFTSYAGLPIVLVEAEVTQDVAHPWLSLHFIEIQLGAADFTQWLTDNSGGGALTQAGEFHPGQRWASVLNDGVLLGACASEGPAVYDGGGQHYGAYLRSGVSPLNALRRPWRGALIIGAGRQAVDQGLVQHWSEVLADPPRVHLQFEPLAARLATVEKRLAERERQLGRLSGPAWAAAHVAIRLAGAQRASARQQLATGRFGTALQAVAAAEKALLARSAAAEVAVAGPVLAGTVMGHPFLANRQVAYLWSLPAEGAGLISIYDRRAGKELLRVEPNTAPLWEVAVKSPEGGKTYRSLGTAGTATCRVEKGAGVLRLRWTGGLEVAIEARLGPADGLLRARMNVRTNIGTEGLTAVTFPVIEGLSQITPEAREDAVLETWGVGNVKPSPLVSGKPSVTEYPNGMQFSALLGDARGFYVAEEDGAANRKQMTWMPDAARRTLGFSISHPVLNWGAEAPVRSYQSAGDFVCGPFAGDWYDAARLYRRWALTAPWSRKGPIRQRKDYPQWLAEAPYWTISSLGDEHGVQQELDKHAFLGVPTMISHAYNYYFSQTMDDRFPEAWPPRLGSEGFSQAVKTLQSRGIRVVPYILGWTWDEDTDSFRMKDARNQGAAWGPRGELTTMTEYNGQAFTAMCPGSRLWRDEMLAWTRELVGRYGVDGVYFDFLTIHTGDCYNQAHGHPIAGGNYWTRAVHGLYEECRALGKSLNPDFMMTGEDIAEYCLDVHDTFLCMGKGGTSAPLFMAVYHGYTNVFGALRENNLSVLELGRPWLLGFQNGWHNWEGAPMMGKPPYQQFAYLGEYYQRLIRCRWEFAKPYLGWGEMLRPPRVTGDLPRIKERDSYAEFTVPAVEGSAWKAPDGSVGLFFLNYDPKAAHHFTWTANLAESAGFGPGQKVRISRWTPEQGLATLAHVAGGAITQSMEAQPLDIIALRLEVAP